jgi:hypothetical protein
MLYAHHVAGVPCRNQQHLAWVCLWSLLHSLLVVLLHAALTLAFWTHILQAFWVPSQAPEAKDLMAKPDTATYCPASGKKLRLKDCVAVKFTQVRGMQR